MSQWQPLEITAKLRGAIALPQGPLALDSLLAYLTCLRDQIPPALTVAEVVRPEIPIAVEPQGRFHLASFAYYIPERSANHWCNRRFPIAEAQMFGCEKLKAIHVARGPQKSYRIPMEKVHVIGDTLTWWCMGEPELIRLLLSACTHLGKKRSVGLGRVERWDVREADTWPGFPVVRDGIPLRPLPLDWPGLVDYDVEMRNLTFPYQVTLNPNEQQCAVGWLE